MELAGLIWAGFQYASEDFLWPKWVENPKSHQLDSPIERSKKSDDFEQLFSFQRIHRTLGEDKMRNAPSCNQDWMILAEIT